MNFKKTLLFTLVLILSASLLVSQVRPRPRGQPKVAPLFAKGYVLITPQIGINSWAIPFGANFEYGLTENIGIGGTLMVWFWSDVGISQSVIAPAAEAQYHFTKLKVPKLDVSGGLGIGWAIYHYSYDWAPMGVSGTGSSGLYLYPFINGRYYFKDKMAFNLRLNFGLTGDWSGVGSTIGVTFRIGE